MQIIQIYFIQLCFLFVLCNYFKFHNNEIKSHYDLISAMQLMFLLIKTEQMINLAGVAFYTCKELIKTAKLLKKITQKRKGIYHMILMKERETTKDHCKIPLETLGIREEAS